MGELERLRPQRRNANRHTQRGMGELEKSIAEDGWIGAITVAADGETFDGSARLETLGTAGLEEPIVIETDGRRPVVVKRTDIQSADEERAKRLALAANKIAADNLSWDPGVLAALAEEMDLSALFRDEELQAIFAEIEQPAQPSDDEAPAIDETKPTRCQPGDVWRVGAHLVACLDSTEPANLDRLVQGRRVGMVVADPPYGIDIVATDVPVGGGEKYNYPFGGVKNAKGLGSVGGAKPFGSKAVRGSIGAANLIDVGKYMPVIGDDSTDTAIAASTLCVAEYPDAIQVWWGANNYANVLPPSTCWIVWDKENTGNFADAELAWTNIDGAVRIFKHMWNGMLRASEHGRRVHPTQKPIAFYEWFYEKYGKDDDTILDPFLGSGPSLKAAERSGRTVIGFELSPHYVDHILSWAEAEGLTVERADG